MRATSPGASCKDYLIDFHLLDWARTLFQNALLNPLSQFNISVSNNRMELLTVLIPNQLNPVNYVK